MQKDFFDSIGQTEKNSVRVYVFRFAPELGYTRPSRHVSNVPGSDIRSDLHLTFARAKAHRSENVSLVAGRHAHPLISLLAQASKELYRTPRARVESIGC